MHAREDGIVRGVQAVPDPGVVRRPPDGVQVLRGVDAGEQGVVGRLRADQPSIRRVEHAQRAGQRHGQCQPHRMQWVVGPHVVLQVPVVPDDRSRAAHGPKLPLAAVSAYLRAGGSAG